ncbi:hypothetical protein PUR71_12550 [Streptomyces sp. SP17BM10]|uniref:hypothetical protein n=1 Tax=Streptomyces sp. SP17BM10 TaxID=3002530 RepID=UPI002E79684B|nr:hypothetical protein [Streptomyces sp. SP17BM10]MEE1783731.1 hypothetical protein [Streptomyces sp. SP17BM10]
MTKKAPGAPPRFVLWREVLTAYAMPAAMAGLGGVATHQPELTRAAVTTIAGTSAVVAALVGSRLRRRPPRSWAARAPRAAVAIVLAIAAASAALAIGLAGAHWLPHVPGLAIRTWPARLPVDLPLSAAIAATLITLRWRACTQVRTPQHRSTAHPERQTS